MKTLKLIILGAIVFGICLPAVSQAGVQPYVNARDTFIQAVIGAGQVLPAAELDGYLAANNGTRNGGVGNGNGNGNGKPKPSKNK